MSGVREYSRFLLFIAIMITSTLLRGSLVVIGPISDIIAKDLAITSTSLGMITAIPLLVFALSSVLIPFIANKNGLINTLMGGIFLIVIGSVLRGFNDYITLLLGTVLLGFGISIGNVLIPAIIKDFAHENKAVFTGSYLCMQNLIASVASGIAIYITIRISWSFLMMMWIVPAIIALVLWLEYKRRNSMFIKEKTNINPLNFSAIKNLLTSSYAWSLSIIMGLQSIIYYTNVAWLPTIASNNNLSQDFISFLMIAFQLIPLPGLFLVPFVFKKIKQDSYIILISSLMIILGSILLMTTRNATIFFIATMLVSLGSGSCFAWVVAAITNKTSDGQQVTSLSAMSQIVGYSLAAIGPWIGGLIVDLTNNSITIMFLILISGILITLISIYIFSRKKSQILNG